MFQGVTVSKGKLHHFGIIKDILGMSGEKAGSATKLIETTGILILDMIDVVDINVLVRKVLEVEKVVTVHVVVLEAIQG